MDGHLHIEACRTANGGGLRCYHGTPDVKQGGAAGYLEKEARATSTPNPHCRTATAVTFGDYSVEEAKNNSENPG